MQMQMQCGAVAKVIVTPTFWPHFVECFCTAAAFSSCSSIDDCKKEFRVFIVCFSLCLIQATSVWPGHRPRRSGSSGSSPPSRRPRAQLRAPGATIPRPRLRLRGITNRHNKINSSQPTWESSIDLGKEPQKCGCIIHIYIYRDIDR